MTTPPRILIVGHGTAGRALAADAVDSGLEVAGFLDDVDRSPGVLGTLADVNQVVTREGIDRIWFAIPSIEAASLRAFVNLVEIDRIDFAIVPRSYATLSRETVALDDLTDVDVLDLVGRRPVKHDLLEARALVEGRRTLVTGAAGSIGSRLVTHLLALGASEVAVLDFGEYGMFSLLESLDDDRVRPYIADAKDAGRIDEIFAACHPELVFHAAAYKHVPLMEANPLEAVANNVGGTSVVLEAAGRHGAAHVVYVSTDKAVNPANVMGTTKRLGELLLTDAAERYPSTRYTAVRFGNVIQSNGSVMETFRRQLASGGPVTVTHVDVTRFFMTIDEAAQLVIQSAVVGMSGDICVLDMGAPVRILDLATSLIKTVAPGTPISIVGLRPGEKLYEELSYEPDLVARTAHEGIFVLREAPHEAVDAAAVVELLDRVRERSVSDQELLAILRSWGFGISS